MSTQEQDLGATHLEAIRHNIYHEWQKIVSNPEDLTDLSEKNILFAAGGGLVKTFGDDTSEIWKSIGWAAEPDGSIQIAGINFNKNDLAQMGEFYRYMASSHGMIFHCIDERLEEDGEGNLKHEVHCGCGACKAVGDAIGLEEVEECLLTDLVQEAKQDIYDSMPNHVSNTILVDLDGADVVLNKERERLKNAQALPFNVSIPLGHIEAWAIGDMRKAKKLIDTMVKWNVQIARNIIGDPHNKLHELADDTQLVVDQRQVHNTELEEYALAQIQQVQHKKWMPIAA